MIIVAQRGSVQAIPSVRPAPEISTHALERYLQRDQDLDPARIQYLIKHYRADIEKTVADLWKRADTLVRYCSWYRQIAKRCGDMVLVFDFRKNKIVTCYKYDETRLPKAA